MKTAEEVARLLGGAKRSAGQWVCRCPAHEDKHASLSVADGIGGRLLVHCHAGCPQGEVFDAVRRVAGLNGEDMGWQPGTSTAAAKRQPAPCPAPKPPKSADLLHPSSGIAPCAIYRYYDAAGDLVFAVARYEPAGGGKDIRPWIWDGARWIPKAHPAPRPLYGLKELVARPDGPVIVVEGEKTALAAAMLFPSHACVTWAGGASADRHSDWSPITGRDVVLCPDNDPPGREAMGRVAERLRGQGCQIRLAEAPEGSPDHWDLADANWSPEQAVAWLSEAVAVQVETAWDAEQVPIEAYESESAQFGGAKLVEPTAVPAPAIILDWKEIASAPIPPRRWLIPHWLGYTPTLLSGLGGVGKSLFSQQVATSIALGMPFIGQPDGAPGTAIIWNCEDERDELARRQSSICDGMGLELDELSGRLVISSRFGLNNSLCVAEYGRPMWTALIEELREQIGDLRARVVFLDNLSYFFGCNENSRADVTFFVGGLAGAASANPNGCAIVMLGHLSKAAGSEFSGSSAWENAVRMRWLFGRSLPDQDAGDSGDDAVRYVSKRKSNYSILDYVQLRYESRGHAGFFAGGEQISEQDAADQVYWRAKSAERAVLAAIPALNARNLWSSHNAASREKYLPKLMMRYGHAGNSTSAELAKALEKLIAIGKVLVEQHVGKNSTRHPVRGLICASDPA